MFRIAYFGLPLGALLLSSDGFEPELCVLSPVEAPGTRRLMRRLGGRVVEGGRMTPDELERAVFARLPSLAVDLVVSWYWTRRIPADWIAAARLGAIGAHPSMLPRHRGPDPFFWAIDSGDVATGVSIHALTDRYDEGSVYYAESISIGDRNAWQLARALDRPSLRLLRRAVGDLSRGEAPVPVPQDEALATWAAAPAGELLRADWAAPTERVLRRIRALAPVPGLALEIHGVRFFVVHGVATREFPAALAAGEAAVTAAGVVVRTGDGAVLLTRATLDDDDDSEPRTVDASELADIVGRAGTED